MHIVKQIFMEPIRVGAPIVATRSNSMRLLIGIVTHHSYRVLNLLYLKYNIYCIIRLKLSRLGKNMVFFSDFFGESFHGIKFYHLKNFWKMELYQNQDYIGYMIVQLSNVLLQLHTCYFLLCIIIYISFAMYDIINYIIIGTVMLIKHMVVHKGVH